MESVELFLRGVSDIVAPLNHVKNTLQPYLGNLVSNIFQLAKDSIPIVKESYRDEHENLFRWRGEVPSFKRTLTYEDESSPVNPRPPTLAPRFGVLAIQMRSLLR